MFTVFSIWDSWHVVCELLTEDFDAMDSNTEQWAKAGKGGKGEETRNQAFGMIGQSWFAQACARHSPINM
eukprot:5728970-Alexandrium_andersonii.AAC.1